MAVMICSLKYLPIVGALLILWSSCATKQSPEEESLINLAHLEHLYEEVPIGADTLGAVWIYCEAPDYHLVGDEDEGFTCVDDVARAMVFYCRQFQATQDPELLSRIGAMTEFLLYMQAENGFFYNFLLPGPEVNTLHQNSRAIPNWWSWRAFWALSELNLLENGALTNLQRRSRPVMDTLVEKMQGLCTPQDSGFVLFDLVPVPECLADLGADQVGVIMIGLTNYYRINPSEPVRALLISLGELLLTMQHGDAQTWPHGAIMSWRNLWHAWGNSQAYALLYTGRVLDYELFIPAGLMEARYFYPYYMDQGFLHAFQVTKSGDTLLESDLQRFPQIAYNIRPMIYASLEAYSITGDSIYAGMAGRLATWFFGNNPAKQRMYDPASGRTFDGIGSPKDINRNSGAESTIEALLSLQAIEAVPEAKRVLQKYISGKD